MIIQGTLSKMKTELKDTARYTLPVGKDLIPLNEKIGKKLDLKYLGEIYCLSCGQPTKNSYAQGYCYTCFQTAPETSPCILRPDLCEAHLGISRDMEWSKQHCLQDHYVYLAITSGLKVGVTRSSQIPTRWIDQGAVKVIKLAKTPNRHIAGVIESDLKHGFNDKTNWQRMLKNKVDITIDLVEAKQQAWELLLPDLREYIIEDDEVTEIKYPVKEFPQKVNSMNFDQNIEVGGILTGIKGQYLYFDYRNVFNIRRHGGYLISLEMH